MAEVKIPIDRGELPAYLATFPGQGLWPGVVVLKRCFGHEPRREGAGRLAGGEAYLALAPDLCHSGRS